MQPPAHTCTHVCLHFLSTHDVTGVLGGVGEASINLALSGWIYIIAQTPSVDLTGFYEQVTRMHARTQAHARTRTRAHMHMRLCMHIRTRVQTCVRMRTRAHAHTQTHTHTQGQGLWAEVLPNRHPTE